MVTLTTTNGTFESDSIKEALRAERKAAKQKSKENRIRQGRRHIARIYAQAQAWQLYCKKRDGEPMPRAWRFLPAGTPHMACKVLPSESTYSLDLEIETADGKGVLSWWRADFVGVIENGAGFVMAVMVQFHNEQEPQFLAVGTHEGQASFEPMPGWAGYMFRNVSEEN